MTIAINHPVISSINDDFFGKIVAIQDISALESLRVEFLGKKGILTEQLQKLGSMDPDSRRVFGAELNVVKDYITEQISLKKDALEKHVLEANLLREKIDITLPPRNYETGKIHPISQITMELTEIFALMGFAEATGPEIENDWNNFTALNIPEIHPARQMHDTFYVNESDGKLLRTHTSTVQIRYMEQNKPPIRIISAGKVYRSDYDATHSPMFHQIEALCIDKDINIGHLKGCIETFLRLFFEVEEAPIRLRPSYFPFTEPSLEVDVRCDKSSGEIKIGKGQDWLEIMGCGMVHPNVLKNVGIDPEIHQGFALGAGIERLAMLKYNIPDLRAFYEGDVRWLSYYGF